MACHRMLLRTLSNANALIDIADANTWNDINDINVDTKMNLVRGIDWMSNNCQIVHQLSKDSVFQHDVKLCFKKDIDYAILDKI